MDVLLNFMGTATFNFILGYFVGGAVTTVVVILGLGMSKNRGASKTCSWQQVGIENRWAGACGAASKISAPSPAQEGIRFCPGCGEKIVSLEPNAHIKTF